MLPNLSSMFSPLSLPAAPVCELMFAPALRVRFDTTFKEYRIVKDFGDHRILYTRCPMTVPFVSDRDFVVAQVCRRTPTEVCAINKQIDTDLAPKVSGVVRANTLCASFIIRDTEGDECAATMCHLLQAEYKMSVPASAINSRIASMPAAFIKRIQDFITHVYKAELAAAES
eukprot:scpid99427/ scgid5973/ 